MIQCRSRKHTKCGESLSFFHKTSRRKMRNENVDGRIQIKLRFDTFGTITHHFSSVYWFFLLTKKCVFTSDQKLLRIWFYREFLSILFVTFIRRQNNNSSMKIEKSKKKKKTIEFFCYSYYYYLLLSFGFCSDLSVDDKRDEKEKEKNTWRVFHFKSQIISIMIGFFENIVLKRKFRHEHTQLLLTVQGRMMMVRIGKNKSHDNVWSKNSREKKIQQPI